MKRRMIMAVMVFLTMAGIVISGCARETVDNSWPRIERTKKVVIGLDDTFVPMGFRQKNGQLAGYDIDLAKAVFKRYGIKADFQTIDWSMKETELKNQTIDLIWNGYSVTPERKAKVAFSNDYLINHQIVVTKTKSQINTLKDMKGKTLGVQTGLDAQPKLLKNMIANKTPILYDTFNDAFIDLDAGRIQGILMDEVYARYYIAHKPDPASYHIIGDSFPPEQFAVGMRKSDHVLREKINAGLKALKADGTIAKLQKKWFGKVEQ